MDGWGPSSFDRTGRPAMAGPSFRTGGGRVATRPSRERSIPMAPPGQRFAAGRRPNLELRHLPAHPLRLRAEPDPGPRRVRRPVERVREPGPRAWREQHHVLRRAARRRRPRRLHAAPARQSLHGRRAGRHISHRIARNTIKMSSSTTPSRPASTNRLMPHPRAGGSGRSHRPGAGARRSTDSPAARPSRRTGTRPTPARRSASSMRLPAGSVPAPAWRA